MSTLRKLTQKRFILLFVLLCAIVISGCGDPPTYADRLPTPMVDRSPVLRLQPDTGWAGEYVQVSGEGWPPNQLIMVHLEDARGRSGFMSAASSDANGVLSTGFTWPISERWLTPGPIQVVAQGQDDSRSASTNFVVMREGETLPTPTVAMTETAVPEITETATAEATATVDAATPTVTASPEVLAPVAVENVVARRLTTPPTLDGDLGEWQGVQGYRTPFVVEQLPEWDGSMDVEAIWRFGWDTQNLYVGVAVTDDLIVQENIPQFAYFGDSLEMELDTDLDGDLGPTVSRDDFQYIITPGNLRDLPPATYRFQGTNEGRLTDAPGTMARVALRRTDSGYNLEFSIPWSDVNLAPRSGLVMGATFSVNDNDVPGSERKQYLLLSNVAGRLWSTPDSWGTLTLSD